MGQKNKNFSGSIILFLLALMFLATGISKLIQAETQLNDFESWGYSSGFMIGIGILEILGAIGLLVPRTRFLAVLGLSTIMLGAIATHMINSQYLQALLPLLLIILLGFVFVRNKATIASANLTEDDQAEY